MLEVLEGCYSSLCSQVNMDLGFYLRGLERYSFNTHDSIVLSLGSQYIATCLQSLASRSLELRVAASILCYT
jgi:hypothetical protein